MPTTISNYNLLNILVVDCHRIFREGLLMILRNLDNVGNLFQAGTSMEALQELKFNCCDLVMLGYFPPVTNGATCTREIKRLYPATKVIALSTHVDEANVSVIFDNGADGYLLKDTDGVEIELAISSVIRGRHYFSRDIACNIIDKTFRNIAHVCQDNFKQLNSREKEILKLLYDEYNSKEIAEKLFISERTVEFHRQNLIKKTGAKNIVGLIKYAISNEMISSELHSGAGNSVKRS
jgi:DNA-binding NarL/FixJ family response regulator